MSGRIRRGFNRHRRTWYGVIGAVVIVGLILVVTGIGQAHIGKKSYTADFAQAGGIRPGDKVRVAGIDVGEVSDTSLQRDHVKVTMKVDNDVDVTSNGSAEIKMSTLLGQRYVDVSLGDSSQPAPDGRIAKTAVPYDLQKTLEVGTPVIAGVDDTALAQSITSLNAQLSDAPALARPTIDSLVEMSKIVTNRKDQITQLLADTNTVTSVVNDTQTQLAIIVGQGGQLAQKIAAREALVTKLLDGVAALVDQSRAVAAENRDSFAPIMANLDTISQGLQKNQENLRKLLQILPVTSRMLNNIMADGPHSTGYLPWGLFPDNWLCTARVVDGC